MRGGHLLPGLADAALRPRDRRRSVEPHPSTSSSASPSGSSTSSGGMSSAMPVDLRLPQVRHPLVVLGVVGDVAGHVLLLQPADLVLEPRRAGKRPRARQVLVAQVRHEPVVVVRRGREPRLDRRAATSTSGTRHGSEEFARYVSESSATGVRYFTAMRTASIAASKQPPGVYAATTGIGDSPWRPYMHGEQVGLLGLGRHAGRGPGAHDVDDDHRQLERDGQTDRLLLEIQARAARARDPEMPGERRPERHAGGRDLVLGLERAHAEVLSLRQLVQQLGRGRDRIAGVEDRQAAAVARRDQAPREGRRAGDVPVRARAAAGAGFTG